MIKQTSVPISILQYITDASRVIDSFEALLEFHSNKLVVYMKGGSTNLCWMELQYKLKNNIDVEETSSIGVQLKSIKKLTSIISNHSSKTRIIVNKSENFFQLNVNRIQLCTPGIDIDRISTLKRRSTQNNVGEVVLSGSALNLGFKATKLIDNLITLRIDPKNCLLTVVADGDNDSMRFECKQSMINSINVDKNNMIEKTLIGDYFEKLQPKIPDRVEVLISLSNRGPLAVSYSIPNVEASITYFLPVKFQN